MAKFQFLGSKVRVEVAGQYVGLYETMEAAEVASNAYQGVTR